MTGVRPRRAGSLAHAVPVVTTVVALLTAALIVLFAWRMTHTAVERQLRHQLAREAELLSHSPRLSALLMLRERQLIGSDGVRLAVVGPDGTVAGDAASAVTAGVREALLDGRTRSGSGSLGGDVVLIEARPTQSGGGVVLTQPESQVGDSAARLRGMYALPVAASTVVAGLAGLVLAGRLTRPLGSAAAAARRLAAGERGVRIPPDGPRELSDLAAAVNTLDEALARSESRQREFLLSVSHELRTPLTTLSGYAEALADGVVTEDDTTPTGRVMVKEAARLERFVGDLLSLARLEADDFRVERQPVDLTTLLREATDAWRGRCARHGVQLSAELPDGPVVVTSDGMRLRQIVDGLSENALRVVPEGAPLVFALRTAAGEAVVEVRDGGPGLTPQDAEVAFERGALNERYRGIRPVGSGLGLAIVHRMVGRLGGTVEVDRAPEGGARFSVRLPLRPTGPRRHAPGPESRS